MKIASPFRPNQPGAPENVFAFPVGQTDQHGSGYIPSLDGWRAVAISLVVVSHGLWHAARPFEKLGALGVNLFFAISGFLICTLLLRELESNGRISLRHFYIRRAFRILPPALAYLAVVTACAALGWIAVRPHELPTALLLANYFPDRLWFTAHFWSLSLEEHFYLFWPALLVLLGTRRAIWSGLGLAAVCVATRPWIAEHVEGAFRYQRTEMRLDAFLLPCLLAILFRNPAWRERASRWLTGPAVAAMVAAIVAGSLLAEGRPQFNSFNKLLQAGLLPLIVAAPVVRPATALAKLLNLKPLRWLGGISYGVYLWQEIFLYDTSSTPGRLLLFPVAVAAILLCAWCSARFLERPLRQSGRAWADRLMGTGTPTPVPAAGADLATKRTAA